MSSLDEIVNAPSQLSLALVDPDAALDQVADEIATRSASMTVEERAAASKTFQAGGNDAFRLNKMHEAIYRYSVALAFDPSNAALYSNRAAAHIKIEEYVSLSLSFLRNLPSLQRKQS